MSYDGWSDEGRALPRVEELPVGEQGYERDAVHAAFDAFYRHIAQLDSTLKTLEAVEVFQRQAGELRGELRSLRSAGWTQQPWSSYPLATEARGIRPFLSPALPRIAAEVAFIIAVAVVVGVGHFSTTLIVVLMAASWGIVGIVEWFAGRERIPGPVAAAGPAVAEEAAAPAPRAPERGPEPEQPPSEYGWSAFSEESPNGGDAMTIAGGTPNEEEPPAATVEPEPGGAADSGPQPGPDADGGPRRGWFRRRHEEAEPAEQPAPEPPSHVRVLPADDRGAEPWERAFDADADEALASEAERDEETDENEQLSARRRFRRR